MARGKKVSYNEEGVMSIAHTEELIEEWEVMEFTEEDKRVGYVCTIPGVYIKYKTYERALKEAGFIEIEIIRPAYKGKKEELSEEISDDNTRIQFEIMLFTAKKP